MLRLANAINSYSLQIGTWATCQNCQQPSKEVALNRKWKNTSFRYTKFKNSDIQRIGYGKIVIFVG